MKAQPDIRVLSDGPSHHAAAEQSALAAHRPRPQVTRGVMPIGPNNGPAIGVRLIAATLALGATVWGILLLPGATGPDVTRVGALLLIPGYIVTMLYWVRVFSLPP